jgi:signal transduction protein with GAF and PtsI domain
MTWSRSPTGRYVAKPSGRSTTGPVPPSDPYLRALDETALALLDRHDQNELLETIVERSTALLGTSHGFVYLLEPDGASVVLRIGTGLHAGQLGFGLAIGEGLAGMVVSMGKPVSIDAYDTWPGRSMTAPSGGSVPWSGCR